MKNWTVDYSLEEKLEILEKEWLPIVIDRASKKHATEETIEFFEKYGFLPIDKTIDIYPNTFEDYLKYKVISNTQVYRNSITRF